MDFHAPHFVTIRHILFIVQIIFRTYMYNFTHSMLLDALSINAGPSRVLLKPQSCYIRKTGYESSRRYCESTQTHNNIQFVCFDRCLKFSIIYAMMVVAHIEAYTYTHTHVHMSKYPNTYTFGKYLIIT